MKIQFSLYVGTCFSCFWCNKNCPRDCTLRAAWLVLFYMHNLSGNQCQCLKDMPGLDRHVWVGTPDSLWKLFFIWEHHCNNRPSSIHSASALKILGSAAVVIFDILAEVEVEVLYYTADSHVEESEHDRPPHECWCSVGRGKGQFILPSFYNSSSDFILEDTCKW